MGREFVTQANTAMIVEIMMGSSIVLHQVSDNLNLILCVYFFTNAHTLLHHTQNFIICTFLVIFNA